jgi:phosphoglycolate phosphatase
VESATAELADDLLAQARVLFDEGYFSALHQATGVYPGVEACLQRLEALKIPVALVTNKPRRFTLPLLESLGWSERFNSVVCGDDLPQKKPLPDPLLYACQQLAIPASEALMVGDSRNDISAAKAAGMANVAVPYGYNHGEAIELCEPGCVVQQLDELVSLNYA